MIDTNNWLDISGIIRNEIIGDTNLFIICSMIAILWYCTIKRMPWQVMIAIELLFVFVAFELYSWMTGIVLVLIMIGFTIWDMKKMTVTQ